MVKITVTPAAAELDSHEIACVRQAMEEGALGVGTSLIYPPAFFAKTEELIELCKEASKYGGSYISHMRSEGNKFYEAVEELITHCKRSKYSCGDLSFKSSRKR